MTISIPSSLTGEPVTSDWKEVLADGEALLWQGRPGVGLVFELSHFLRLMRGAVMLGLFLYMLGRLRYGIASYWDIRAIVLFVFFLPVPLDLVKSMITRRMQRYGLTNARAIITTNLGPFGRKVQSFPLTPEAPLTLIRRAKRSSILFSQTPKWYTGLITPAPVVGFERIVGAESVYALMRRVHAGDV